MCCWLVLCKKKGLDTEFFSNKPDTNDPFKVSYNDQNT
jgi:hypothetical protein